MLSGRHSTSRCLVRAVALLTISLAAFASPAVAQDSGADAAADLDAAGLDILKRAPTRRGVAAFIGTDAYMLTAWSIVSQFRWYVRVPTREAADAMRAAAANYGYGIDRVVVEHGDIARLPFADGTVDLVAIPPSSKDDTTLEKLRRDEVLRALRPGGAALGGGPTTEALTAWAGGAGADAWNDAKGRPWIRIDAPALDGADDWTHWEKGPDNNPVSNDRLIKAPYMTQFLAEPYYIGMPSVTTAAGGRTFLAIGHIAHHRREWGTLNRLIARNGFNGTVLWERSLKEGYLVHRSAFVATAHAFYMVDDDHCLVLDPETGAEKGKIRIPGVAGAWKWMVLDDGILYVLAGEPGPGTETTKGDRLFGGWSWADLSKGYYGGRIPHGFGDTLAAWDVESERALWVHREKKLIDARGMALRDGKVFLYCPDLHLRSLEAKTGKVQWTNADAETLALIEQPGRRLISTPGFRTACMTVATPKALIIQGQTRNNVIAVSTSDGYLLWQKKKITNNPNAVYIDDQVILGVGPGGSHVALDPVEGTVQKNLGFRKRACTRLTASTDSLFCRGEGTLRYDRDLGKVMIDSSIRPACNDGALPANGLLYLGPWQCDCNLTLIGHMGKCSAGDFRFDIEATDARLERGGPQPAGEGLSALVAPSDRDWPTYRGDNSRSAGTKAPVATQNVRQLWVHTPKRPYVPTAPTAANGLIFLSGDDGKIRTLDARNGQPGWDFALPAPVRYPPTIAKIANGMAYVGCQDGWVYALDAATGTFQWRFRAAPIERHIMVYGRLSSTWPVASGVLVDDGVAYFAAGIVDYDGTYVYALDAKTGAIRWQNNSSGHLDAAARKGVSVQGNLSLQGGQLLLAGGNQVSPARYDLATGACEARVRGGGPRANAGRFVGVFRGESAIIGGRILYSSPRNVSTKGSFAALTPGGARTLAFGGIPPAWNDKTAALVNMKRGKLVCCDADTLAARLGKGGDRRPTDRPGGGWLRTIVDALRKNGELRWESDLGGAGDFEVLSLAVAPNAVVAVVSLKERFRAHPERYVVAFGAAKGRALFRQRIPGEPLPGGLLIDRDGRIVVTLLDGRVACWGS